MRINAIGLVAGLALGGMLLCSTVATAQDAKEGKKGGRRGASVEQQLDRLSTELQLTDAQKPKVKAVLEDTAKKRQELRADTSVPQEQRREKMMTMMQEQSKQIKAILTPEQQEKYQKMIDQRRQNRPAGGKKSDSAKQE
jgi:Spy/CpxP family protein refolding chaperone